jgi:hypothetical protein
MTNVGMQEAGLVLGELQEDARYKALNESGADNRFNEFRQAVEQAQIRCFAMYPPDKATEVEIRDLLGALRAECTGTLAQFQSFLDDALAALDR